MPKAQKVVITDDYDGKELPDDTQPISFSMGRTTYNLYLSEKNHEALLKAVTPFIQNAETAKSNVTLKAVSSDDKKSEREKMKKVREWAQATGYKFKDAAGNEKTLGDRGRIPDEVVAAYDAAN